MNVNYEKLDNVTGVITIDLEEKDYADKVSKQLKEIGRTHAEPGFRPGKVPAGLIAKKYGTAVKYDVINNLVGETVYDYIKENKLPVLGQPLPEEGNAIDEDKNAFTFKFKVGVAPEIDSHVGKDMTVPYYTITVTDEMVNDQIEQIRQRYGRQEPGEQTEPNAVIKGEITELNEDGSVKEEGVKVENGILGPVHFKDEAQKALFADKKPGDDVVFNPWTAAGGNATELASMLNLDQKDIESHKGDFRFNIKEIIVLKPAELTQELFDTVTGKDKVHSEEEFRAEVKNLMAENFKNDQMFRFTVDAKAAVEKAVGPLELPVAILKDFLKRQSDKINDENIDAEFEGMLPQLTWDLIRDSIAEKFEVKVNDADVMDEARGTVARQLMQFGPNMLTDEIIDRYAQNLINDEKTRSTLLQNAVNRKVYEVIKDNVTLDNKEVSVAEFNALFETAQA